MVDWGGGIDDGVGHSQDSFRVFFIEYVIHEVMPQVKAQNGCRSPELMYLTWPATQTTKLPSGRPSTNRLRLRSYSDAGIPGVTSPCLTIHTCARASAMLCSGSEQRNEMK